MPTKNLLIISYVFPPVGGIMVQRMLSFARYLPQNGINVSVLSCWNPATPVYDESLLKLVPPEVKQFHAFTPEPPFYLRKKVWALLGSEKQQTKPTPDASAASPGQSPAPPPAPPGGIKKVIQKLLSPDAQVLWTPFAKRRAAAIIRKHNIDTVLVTAPPFSLFLVGNYLKKKFPHIKLVSDFRDEWLRFMLTDFAHYSGDETRLEAERIERETIESSDLVLAVTYKSLEEIRSRYPNTPESKWACIHNGYDPAMFTDFHPKTPVSPNVVVTHTGTAYKTSSPVYYLDALDKLPEQMRSRVETRFIGRVAETETVQFENRKSNVKLFGFLPQSEALKHSEETDYLLLTMTNDFSLPGKLFEYLATGKRIIALSPANGEVDLLLRDTKAGWCVPHDNPAAIDQMLREAIAQARDNSQPDWEAIRAYERPRLAAKLAARLKQL